MAEVTITLIDTKDGGVKIATSDKGVLFGDNLTGAEYLAKIMLKDIYKTVKG